MKEVVFLVLPHAHVLDLSGPVQVFYEAAGFGARYRLRYCGVESKVRSAQGLWLSDLEPLPEVGPGDLVLVPGIDSATLGDLRHVPTTWLRGVERAGASIASICTGAFALAHAGLLDHRPCTTHWKVADRLQETYPTLKVIKNRLFVKDRGIVTSAGVASGIDMALAQVEEDQGALVAAKVAREIVVYLRRDGTSEQTSIYLSYRTHLHPGIHRVQDWLVAHPETRLTIEELGRIAGMSPRNLTREFRRATGVTLKTFSTELKLEVAKNLLHDPGLTVDHVAAQCGFSDSRQLRRLCKSNLGANPSAWRGGGERRLAR